MSRACQKKMLQKQCKIHLSKNNLGKQKVLESSFFELSERLKSKNPKSKLNILGSL